MSKSEYYRTKADECERMAGTVVSPEHKAPWLKLASDWLALIPEALRLSQTRAGQFDAMERQRGTHQQKSQAEH